MDTNKKEPIVYSIGDLTEILKISRSMAYQIARNKDFPKVKIGKRILIPADGLKEWLLKQAHYISA